MAEARWHHAAALLPDGRVLVTGGDGSTGQLASAELYNPATNNWSPAGSIADARSGPTATLLADGRVLVAGGWSGSSSLSSAELYDPAANTWSPAAAMADARWNHTATLLADGRVLVVGGFSDLDSAVMAKAELYDPAADTWTPAGSMAADRYGHTATLLPDGRVLVTGGGNDSSELYDPLADAWFQAGSMAASRRYQAAVLLLDGSVLVAGGSNTLGDVADSELFNPNPLLPDDWRPEISSVNSQVHWGLPVHFSGAGLRGYKFIEAAGGGTNSSASNYPLVQLRRLDNGQVTWLNPTISGGFTGSAYTSSPLPNFAPGHALLTVFVNGIPSASHMVLVNKDTVKFYLPVLRR
jgi:N-acetylneuraminic acid mutarotase